MGCLSRIGISIRKNSGMPIATRKPIRSAVVVNVTDHLLSLERELDTGCPAPRIKVRRCYGSSV